MSTGIILFAHGARDPAWAEPVHRLQRMLTERMPGAIVESAYLDHTLPTLEDAAQGLVTRGVSELSIVPVFIAAGSHLKEDLPRRVAELAAQHPEIPVRIAPPIGEADTIHTAISAWIEAMHKP